MNNNRGNFSGKLGFILAAAGSAVGLGNIWRFPYLTAKYGGGAFVFTYIILVVTFGFTLLITEVALGRKTMLSPIGAYKAINKKWGFIGYFSPFITMLIVPYYSLIGGWIIKYFVLCATGGLNLTADEKFFESFTSSTFEPIFWQAVFVIGSVLILLGGVKNGIEKVNKILMPMLIVISVGIVLYLLTLPGALEGFKFLLIPDFSKFTVTGFFAAMGQMFFSMSIAMGVMITYGSYMNKEDDIENCVGHIELFDTGIAIIASMMIIPAVFAFSNGSVETLSKGPALMFVALPRIFESMPFGSFVAALFFLLVLFAAVTSVVSLMEAFISILCDNLKLDRKIATLILTVLCIGIGVFPSLGFGIWSDFKIFNLQILDIMDFVSNYILMPLSAFFSCILIAYVAKPDVIISEIESNGLIFKRKKLYVFVLKYIAPIFTILILITSILDTMGIIKL